MPVYTVGLRGPIIEVESRAIPEPEEMSEQLSRKVYKFLAPDGESVVAIVPVEHVQYINIKK